MPAFRSVRLSNQTVPAARNSISPLRGSSARERGAQLEPDKLCDQTGTRCNDARVSSSAVDSLPYSGQPHGLCPRCGRTSNFASLSRLALRSVRPPSATPGSQGPEAALEQVAKLNCMGCGVGTAIIEVRDSPAGHFKPILWWPSPSALSGAAVSDVPGDIVAAFDEGVRCVSVLAPTAAVTMFRNTIAQIVKDKGSESAKAKSTLNDAIVQMADEKTLHESFAEWAHHVRKVGNAGAHQESWEAIPIEQARELQELTAHLIDTLYVLPAKLARAMPPRKSPKPGPPPGP